MNMNNIFNINIIINMNINKSSLIKNELLLLWKYDILFLLCIIYHTSIITTIK